MPTKDEASTVYLFKVSHPFLSIAGAYACVHLPFKELALCLSLSLSLRFFG
jgi:hypothetical protein